MPKPTTKSDLLAEMKKEREALETFLATLSPDQMTQPGIVGEWSAKDVLGHLIEWEQMVINWYCAGKRGENPPTPAEDLKWSQIPELNQRIYQKHRERPLEEILGLFKSTHEQMLALVLPMSEEELFKSGCYAWTRTNALASYINSCTGAHFRWARTEIRKGLKAK